MITTVEIKRGTAVLSVTVDARSTDAHMYDVGLELDVLKLEVDGEPAPAGFELTDAEMDEIALEAGVHISESDDDGRQ